jgi:hypothetical protein
MKTHDPRGGESQIEDGKSARSDSGLAAKKLEAELENLKKESSKLDEEIANLKRARGSQLKNLTWWRDLLGIFSVVVMLFFSGNRFLNQQEEASRFQLTAEVIRLVEMLWSDDPAQSEQAAVLLAPYGDKAVPILLDALGIARDPEGGPAMALAVMARADPKLVVPLLLKRAGTVYKGVENFDTQRAKSLINYLLLLGKVGDLVDRQKTVKLFDKIEKELDCKYFRSESNTPLDAESADVIDENRTQRVNLCLRQKEARGALADGT